MSIRLDKYLSNSDKMLSRREAAAVIRRGSVALDGVTVKDPSRHVNEGVTVTLDGDRVTYQEFIYLMMNKPAGCVTAMSDRRGGERLVTEFLPAELLRRDISPVGRLDRDTTGLLIFTDDGMSAHRALSPKTHVTKTYLFECEPELTDEGRLQIEAGVDIGERDGMGRTILTAPSKVDGDRISVTEGKFHQIKRMFHAVGCEITSLCRLEFAGIMLDPALMPGGWRYLDEDEIQKFVRK